MENKIILDTELFKLILDSELRKLTGKTMKRFELSKDVEEIKNQVKEIQYEWGRDLLDAFKTGKIIFKFGKEEKKE